MKYESLAELIEPYADGPFNKLPEGLRERVENDFSARGLSWDCLTPDQRRSLAQQHDWKHDPVKYDPALRQEQDAAVHVGYYGLEHVQAWLTMGAITPQNAALLFFGENPSKYKNNLPEMGVDFDLMKWSLEDVARDGRDRNLSEWATVARARNLRGVSINGWQAAITQTHADTAPPAQNIPTSAPGATNCFAKLGSNKSEKTLILEAKVLELMGKFWNDRTLGTTPTKSELSNLVYGEMLRGEIRGDRKLTAGMVRDAAKPWKIPLVLPAFVPDSKFNDKRHPFKGEI